MIKREYTFFNSQRVQFDKLRQLKGICSLSPVSTFAFLLTPFAFLLAPFTDLLACAAYFLDSFFRPRNYLLRCAFFSPTAANFMVYPPESLYTEACGLKNHSHFQCIITLE